MHKCFGLCASVGDSRHVLKVYDNWKTNLAQSESGESSAKTVCTDSTCSRPIALTTVGTQMQLRFPCAERYVGKEAFEVARRSVRLTVNTKLHFRAVCTISNFPSCGRQRAQFHTLRKFSATCQLAKRRSPTPAENEKAEKLMNCIFL